MVLLPEYWVCVDAPNELQESQRGSENCTPRRVARDPPSVPAPICPKLSHRLRLEVVIAWRSTPAVRVAVNKPIAPLVEPPFRAQVQGALTRRLSGTPRRVCPC